MLSLFVFFCIFSRILTFNFIDIKELTFPQAITASEAFSQGIRCYYGLESKQKNSTEALDWFVRATQLGNNGGLFYLGLLYYHGPENKRPLHHNKELIQQNFDGSFQLFTLATQNKDDIYSQHADFYLELQHLTGRGVEQRKDNMDTLINSIKTSNPIGEGSSWFAEPDYDQLLITNQKMLDLFDALTILNEEKLREKEIEIEAQYDYFQSLLWKKDIPVKTAINQIEEPKIPLCKNDYSIINPLCILGIVIFFGILISYRHKTASSIEKQKENAEEQREIINNPHCTCCSRLVNKQEIEVPSKEDEFECPLCLEDFPLKESFKGVNCKSLLCHPCARAHILNKISEGKVPIPCSSGCCTYEETDVKLILNPDDLDRFYQCSLESVVLKMKDLTHCPQPDCKGIADTSQSAPYFECPVCLYSFCMSCQSDWHHNQSCEKYQEWKTLNSKGDDKIQNMLKNKKFISCPTCANGVEKETGCNHMTCRCGTHFCYLCGVELNSGDLYMHFNRGECKLFHYDNID